MSDSKRKHGFWWVLWKKKRLCNTTVFIRCPLPLNFSHSNDPSIMLLPWQPVVNQAWPSPVIQCLSIHLHSLPSSVSVSLSNHKLPLFLHHSPHSHTHYAFFPISLCVFFLLLCGCIIATVIQAVNTATQTDVILHWTVCSHLSSLIHGSSSDSGL